jgi:CRISPR-associated protein Cas2
MSDTGLNLSEYKGVWIFAMFDLPTESKEDRLRYTQFRTLLLKHGYEMLQYSVYARYYPSEEAAQAHRKHIKQGLPPAGQVRLLMVTDKQFGKMETYLGKKKQSTEEAPEQMMFF